MKALKIGLVIVALAIAVYFYFVSTTKQYKKADVETSRMAPNLKPGLKRSTVENTLKANGFKINDTSPSKKDPVHRQNLCPGRFQISILLGSIRCLHRI